MIPSELSQVVNIGNVPNDGTGDDLRTAFQKINSAFDYVGQNFSFPVTAENIGSVGLGIFKSKTTEGVLQLKKIAAEDNLTIEAVGDSLVVKFTPGESVAFDEITANKVTASIEGNVTGNLTGLVLTASQPNITGLGILTSLTVTSAINADLTGDVIGNVSGNVSGNLTGNVTGLVRSNAVNEFVDINSLESRINTFDYGPIVPINVPGNTTRSFRDPHRYLLYVLGTDMGTINDPSEFGIDAGAI